MENRQLFCFVLFFKLLLLIFGSVATAAAGCSGEGEARGAKRGVHHLHLERAQPQRAGFLFSSSAIHLHGTPDGGADKPIR